MNEDRLKFEDWICRKEQDGATELDAKGLYNRQNPGDQGCDAMIGPTKTSHYLQLTTPRCLDCELPH